MRTIALDGMFGSASDNFAIPFVPLFALILGATKTEIGLLAALQASAGYLLQLPLAAITGRVWQRKYWYLLSGVLGRGLWLPVALLPFYASGGWAIRLCIILLTLRALAGALGVPPWTALVADVVPRRVRGGFFARRNVLIVGAQTVATLTAGWIIRCWPSTTGYQILFATALGLGLIAAAVFARLQEPEAPSQPAGLKAHVYALASLKKNDLFIAFALSSAVWMLGESMPIPFFPVYFVDKLGGPAYMWAIVTSVANLVMLFGQRYWGLLVDRFGAHRIMVIAGVGAALVPLQWWLVPHWRFIFLVNIFSGFMWAGYMLGSFNLLLEVTPRAHRAAYVALFNGIVGVAATVAPLAGGIIADKYSIRLVLLLASLLRLSGWACMWRFIHSPTSRPLLPTDLLPRRMRMILAQRGTMR